MCPQLPLDGQREPREGTSLPPRGQMRHWWSVESERKWKRAHSHKSLPISKPAREPSQLERCQNRGRPRLRLCSLEEEVGTHYSSHSLPGAFEFIHTTCESWFCLELARWTSSYRCTNTGGGEHVEERREQQAGSCPGSCLDFSRLGNQMHCLALAWGLTGSGSGRCC